MKPDADPMNPAPGMHIWGWMSPAELYWLQEQAGRMDSVAEIGCLHGRSAYALLSGCAGLVYCVDPWDDAADASFASFMGNCGHFPNLRAIRARSPLDPEFGDVVDMTFIDGAHSYPAVLADIAAWLPKTRKLICGHDYQNADAGYPGVGDAVREVFGESRISCAPETSIWAVDLTADRSVRPGLPTTLDYVDEYGRGPEPIELVWP